MKKHDEGYVLAYVTVVLLIFCLVAALLLTGALRNLNHQQDSIQQMQDQYVAEGLIEKAIAENGKDAFYKDMDLGDERLKCVDVSEGRVTLVAQSGTVTVTCVMQESDGKILSYEIGTAEPEPTISEEGQS